MNEHMNDCRNRDQETELALVRPYALTGGRTRSRYGLAPETLLTTSARGWSPTDDTAVTVLAPEAQAMLALCRPGPLALAEAAALLRQPPGVTEVLAGDLAERGLLHLIRPAHGPDGRPTWATLERVLWGLLAAS